MFCVTEDLDGLFCGMLGYKITQSISLIAAIFRNKPIIDNWGSVVIVDYDVCFSINRKQSGCVLLHTKEKKRKEGLNLQS